MRGIAQHGAAADALGGAAPEPRRQHRHVFRPLAQRRHHDADHVEAVPQITPEAPGLDFLIEQAVRRRDEAHVDAPGDGFADRGGSRLPE